MRPGGRSVGPGEPWLRSAFYRHRRHRPEVAIIDRFKGAVGLATALLVIALVLALVGLVLRALRWLLVVAAVLLLIGAGVWWAGRRITGDEPG